MRTDTSADVRIRYSLSPDLRAAQDSQPRSTDPSADFTTKITLSDLKPATTYYLDVIVGGMSQFTAPYPQFKTFPPAGAHVPFKFVVLTDFGTNASSQPPVPDPVATFRNADAENPDFVIIGGDFSHKHYDTLQGKRMMFKLNYSLNSPAAPLDDFVLRILRKYPVAHMWDDHDIGVNNANKNYPYKELARQVLQEYFPVYELGMYGDYQKFSYGQADFFMLDARTARNKHREPDGPQKSMLDADHVGAAGQLQWLKDGLLHSTATWKFIITPVVFNRNLRKPDSWYGFQYERKQIVDHIKNNKISGVVLVSGDLHAGAIDDGTNSDFPEILVPGPNLRYCLTNGVTGTWSVGYYGSTYREGAPTYVGGIPCNGYGVITVDTNPDRATLEVKDTEGKTKLKYTVNR